MPLATMTSSPKALALIKILRLHELWYCHFCTDPVMKSSAVVCRSCGAVMCQQQRIGGSGCIIHNTLSPEGRDDFRCHLCSKVIQYRVSGFAVRSQAKMTWPCTAIVVKLNSLDNHLSESLTRDLEFEYRSAPEKVSPPATEDQKIQSDIFLSSTR